MNTSTHLFIIMGSILGSLVVVGVSVFIRFKFRARKAGRSRPVAPEFEADINEKAEATQSSVVATSWGLYPVPGVGPNRTKTYFNGWFGLSPPSAVGFNVLNDHTGTSIDGPPDTPRESHWTRASRRANKRAARPSLGLEKGGEKDDDDSQDTDEDVKSSEFGTRGGRREKEMNL